MLYLGVVSYGIYLWHIGVFVQLGNWGLTLGAVGPVPAVVVWFVLGLLGTVAVASASWWGMERPLLSLKRLVPRGSRCRVRRRRRSRRRSRSRKPCLPAAAAGEPRGG